MAFVGRVVALIGGVVVVGYLIIIIKFVIG
jgi:hypothetical protein